MSLSSLLVNTCSIKPWTESQSANSGGLLNTLGSATDSVPCAVQTMSARKQMQYGQELGKRMFDVYFAASTTIGLKYLIYNITGSSVGGLSGVTLRVIGPPADHAGRGTYLMVPAEEVRP